VDVGSFHTHLFGVVYVTCGDFLDGSERNSKSASKFLAKHKMAVTPHPPYSPDLAPCNFFLFPKMKLKLKGRWINTIEKFHAESQRVLDTDRK
jgi:hypothetical protein